MAMRRRRNRRRRGGDDNGCSAGYKNGGGIGKRAGGYFNGRWLDLKLRREGVV